MDNEFYENLTQYLKTLTYPPDLDNSQRIKLQKDSTQYMMKNNLLHKRTRDGDKRVILREQVEIILYNLHKDMTGAHLGIDATYEKAKERYYWPQMFDDVRSYTQQCDNCQKRGSSKRKEPLQPIEVKAPFHRVGIDIKGPLPRTSQGNRYIIVAMDYFTKWPEAKSIPDIKSETVAKFIFDEIICRHGVPEELLSDRGTSFLNKIVDTLCEKFQTKHRLTSAYRPQTNGMVERFNRTIGECLAKLVADKEKEWDEYVESVLFAYRTMKHNTTGYTPFYLLYGRQAKLPIELRIPTELSDDKNIKDALMERLFKIINQLENDRQIALNQIKVDQQKQKDRHDIGATFEKFKIGDKVLVERTWLKTNFSAKLEERWMGPYFIHEVRGKNYKLRNMDGRLVKNVIHSDRLKLYYENILVPQILI
jgi:hypothetical protein